MLSISEQYATQHNMVFSVHEDPKKSKSKCVHFNYGKEEEPEKLVLYGKQLPWVDTIEHLGHTIHKSGKQDEDCRQARAKYCEKSNEILSVFDFAHPRQKLSAIDIYCNSWYGAMLWDLYGDAAGIAFRSWNTTVKIAWGLDRATHTYIVDHLLTGNIPSVRQQITKRYIKFVNTLLSTVNPIISLLATLAVNSVQSTTGKNLANIREEYGMNPFTTPRSNFVAVKASIPPEGQSNLMLLDEFLARRETESSDIIPEIDGLIHNICTG